MSKAGATLADVIEVVAGEAANCERAGEMTAPVLNAFYAADLFRLWVPAALGGAELGLPASMETFEQVARADGSCGWIVAIGTGGGLFAAVLERAAAAEVFGSPESVIAGSGQASGLARAAGEGYEATGRWRYASGAAHATWFTANCVIEGAEAAGGGPLIRAMAFRKRAVEVIPAWNVAGMRATASHDFAVSGVRVPRRYSFSVFIDAPWCPGPLYRFPFASIASLSFASVGLGIGRHAIDAFAELAPRKTPSGEAGVLSGMGGVRVRVAEAEALVSSARAYLYEQARAAWEAVCRGDALDAKKRAEAQVAASHAVAACARAADILYEAAGMAPLFAESEIGRCWRDLRVLSQNAAVSTLRLESAGRVLLGGDA